MSKTTVQEKREKLESAYQKHKKLIVGSMIISIYSFIGLCTNSYIKVFEGEEWLQEEVNNIKATCPEYTNDNISLEKLELKDWAMIEAKETACAARNTTSAVWPFFVVYRSLLGLKNGIDSTMEALKTKIKS